MSNATTTTRLDDEIAELGGALAELVDQTERLVARHAEVLRSIEAAMVEAGYSSSEDWEPKLERLGVAEGWAECQRLLWRLPEIIDV
jgi:hypothetical protein